MEGELLRVTDGPEAQQLLGRRKRGMPFELGSNRAATPQGPQGKATAFKSTPISLLGLNAATIYIAIEVHFAPLPLGLEDFANGILQSAMRVRNHSPHAA